MELWQKSWVKRMKHPLLKLTLVLLVTHFGLTIWTLADPSMVSVTGRLQMPTMLIFSLLHASYMLGWRRALEFFALTTVISWGFEHTGVATGLIFGHYHYSDKLGYKLGHVPIAIPLIWFMMMYPSYIIANLIGTGSPVGEQGGTGRIAWLSLLGAITITAWDLAVDPVFSNLGFWVWEGGGPYFGVPLQNFVGWILTTFIIFFCYRLWERQAGIQPLGPLSSLAVWMPPLIYGSQALSVFVRPNLGIITFFAMGFPLLAAINRYWSKSESFPWKK